MLSLGNSEFPIRHVRQFLTVVLVTSRGVFPKKVFIEGLAPLEISIFTHSILPILEARYKGVRFPESLQSIKRLGIRNGRIFY